MSSYQTSNNRTFASLAVAAILASAFVLAFSFPDADRVGESIRHYSDDIRLTLAAAELERGDYRSTAAHLEQVQPSYQSHVLAAKLQIETERYGAAVTSARKAVAVRNNDEEANRLLGLALALNGDKSQTAPKAAQRILALQPSSLALAQELYAVGLLKSSQRLLQADSTPSAAGELLYAEILLTESSDPRARKQAIAHLNSALTIDPASLRARALLVKLLRLEGEDARADEESALLQRLNSGKL